MTISKLRLFVDFDKEEAWLNRMAAEGHLLTRARTTYTFVPTLPGNTVVRIDCRHSMSRSDFEDYVKLFEDSGWRHLDGSRRGGPQYFASFSSDSNVDIFSDASSKAQRYRRSISHRAALLLSFLVLVFILWTQGNIGAESPWDWYLTPGLWDRQGAQFVLAFLFETPFALFRGGLLLIGICVLLVIQMVYQYVLYRREIAALTT